MAASSRRRSSVSTAASWSTSSRDFAATENGVIPLDVAACLAALAEACRGTVNLMPPILDAVKAYATLGEICGAMREVFGEYQAPTVI